MTNRASTTDRILDANFNRLCEGLRVIEDLVRFGLDDAARARTLKALRHDAGRLRAEFPHILSARDSRADVGRAEIREPERRANLTLVLGAAFGRAQESLRTIEELAKLSHPAAAREAKRLRYETYVLEREIRPHFDRTLKARRLRGLYLIMTDPVVGYESLAEIAVREKVTAIQLRAKNMESGPLLALARRVAAIVQGSATLFFINDRPDVARLCDADGVHVGQHDLPVSDARAVTGEFMLVGVSTHNRQELRDARATAPDYIGIGPVFGTTSKQNPDPRLGLPGARRLAKLAAQVPAVAIGGINEANLPALLGSGFQAYALIGIVNSSPTPRAVIRRLRAIEREFLH